MGYTTTFQSSICKSMLMSSATASTTVTLKVRGRTWLGWGLEEW